MKKLLFIYVLIWITVISNGQNNSVTKDSVSIAKQVSPEKSFGIYEPTQANFDRINSAIGAGKICFFGTLAGEIVLGLTYKPIKPEYTPNRVITNQDKIDSHQATMVGIGIGLGLLNLIGLTSWINGVNHKANFAIHLSNYYKGGGATIQFKF
jgi:hypothetical protein